MSRRSVARSTHHISVRDVLAKKVNIAKQQSKIEELRHMWEAIRTLEPDLNLTLTWSQMFPIPKKEFADNKRVLELLNSCQKSRALYRFREALSHHLTSVLCETPIMCKSYGSEDASSDIDVTIIGDNKHLNESLITYVRITKFLTHVFADDPLFTNPSTSRFRLKNVFHFFDINFYLSNFAVKINESDPDDYLSSYILSTAYSTTFNQEINNQYYYAFIEILYKNYQDDGEHDAEMDDQYINSYLQFTVMAQKAQDNSDANQLIDILSKVSTFEDECYHTQGAFFHVVMMMQRKIQFKDIAENRDVFIKMMYASAFENIVFAYTHFDHVSKREKYLYRYRDALRNIELHRDVKQDHIPSVIRPVAVKTVTKNQLNKIIQRYAVHFLRETPHIIH